MRVMTWPIGGDVPAEQVLRELAARSAALRIAPPAALSGEWFGASAVLAPSVLFTAESTPDAAFAVPARQPEVTAAPPGSVGGGWIGYLGYGLTDPAGRDRRLPTAVWGWTGQVLRRDTAGTWWFEALVADGQAAPDARAAEFAALLERAAGPGRRWRAGALRRPDAAEHQKTVRACVEEIEQGEIFQANVCTRFEARFEGDPLDVMTAGMAALRPARAAFLAGGWGAVASFSPELFLARRGDQVRSTPIKGTLPRRNAADDRNERLLAESEKDVAENVMIVDLVRNDLARVCATGSVTVPELLAVRPAPGVWHLASTVAGRLAEGRDDADLLAATFPPGSVTGAPKLRALEVIAELEGFPREVYCGAIGMASPVAGLEMSVAIRTLEFADDAVWLGVGGGITADSDPVREWEECLHKAAPLERLLALT
jgi:para-aminobenzoate synthetase component 1